jgi:hypothetical protein
MTINRDIEEGFRAAAREPVREFGYLRAPGGQPGVRANVSAAAQRTRDAIRRDLSAFAVKFPHIHVAHLGGLKGGNAGGTNIAMVSNLANDKSVIIKCDEHGVANMDAATAIHAVR